MVSVLHANLISYQVCFVVSCFYKNNFSCSALCRGKNSKPFCLAELWLWTYIYTRRGSNILDLNACHILPSQIQLSGGFELKLHSFTIALRPVYGYNPALFLVSFCVVLMSCKVNFTKYDQLCRSNSMCIFKACIDRSDSLRFLHSRRPRVSSEIKTLFITADNSIKCRCTHSGMTGQVDSFQTPGVCPASVSLPFFPAPSPLFSSRHFSREHGLSLLVLCSETAWKRLLRRLIILPKRALCYKIWNCW